MLRRALFQIVVGLCLLAPVSAFAGGWEELYTDKGVTVSRMTVEGSPLVAFKGETVFDASIETIMGILLDNEHRTEWVDRLYEARVIESRGDFEYVVYQAFELPPPFSNRDYVYLGKATRNANGSVTLKMNSVEHAKAPETVGVRANLVNSQYILTPEGDKTRVEVEIITDPMGWMPAWLVNVIQKSWPLDTLDGMRGQLGKPHVKPHALPPAPAGAAPAPAPAEAAPAPTEAAPPAGGEAPAAEAPPAQ